MGELIVAPKRKLHRNAESLDRHDRNRSNGGADRNEDERVLFSVHWRDSVDHECRKYCNGETVEKET